MGGQRMAPISSLPRISLSPGNKPPYTRRCYGADHVLSLYTPGVTNLHPGPAPGSGDTSGQESLPGKWTVLLNLASILFSRLTSKETPALWGHPSRAPQRW